MSIGKGKGSIGHNRREFSADNVDKNRTDDNITVIDRDIKAVYHELFDDALKEFNDRQTRRDRRIPNYYDHVVHACKEQPFYELCIMIGNKDNSEKLNEITPEVLKEFTLDFAERYKNNIVVIGAYIHMDEATPHVQIDYIPVGHKQAYRTDKNGNKIKQGMSVYNSQRQAMIELGYPTGDYRKWHDEFTATLENIAKDHGIKRINLHQGKNDRKGYDLPEYKAAKEEAKRIVQEAQNKADKMLAPVNNLKEQKQQLKDEISALKADEEEEEERLKTTIRKRLEEERREPEPEQVMSVFQSFFKFIYEFLTYQGQDEVKDVFHQDDPYDCFRLVKQIVQERFNFAHKNDNLRKDIEADLNRELEKYKKNSNRQQVNKSTSKTKNHDEIDTR